MADLELDGPNSAISVDTLKPKTGTTLTLGESGDTVTLPSGATFDASNATVQGIAGAIDWQTTAKTSAFTAVSGEGYFVDTTSGAITATLPASPSAGDQVAFKDYAGTFGTNNLTIARNGENIQGNDRDATLETNKASVVLVYVDATKGWLFTNESNVENLTLSVPDAPTIGTATATGATTATVSFTAPADDGGAPITQYTATSNPDSITGVLNQAGSGTITVSGLTEDTSYTFTVTATNSLGTSDPSAASNSVTPTDPNLLTATGGTITTDGDFKVHTFTSSGTFTVTKTSPTSNSVDYLVIAGGGGGGSDRGGGGGAGGYRFSFPNPATGGQPVTTTSYPITVGGGGGGGAQSPAGGQGSQGTNGSSSSAFPITSAGGGGGGGCKTGGVRDGLAGGSGGGGSQFGGNGSGGSGNTPSVSPPQGQNGGTGFEAGGAGGGGGATGTGGNASENNGAVGGTGATLSINGSPVTRAGGGGGGGRQGAGTGGTGGGGNGGTNPGGPLSATAGTANTGGGGGGGGEAVTDSEGASGGSGVVIIRYKFQ